MFENPSYMHGISCISLVGSSQERSSSSSPSPSPSPSPYLVEGKVTMAMEKNKNKKKMKKMMMMKKKIDESCSSSSSSIGKNSDVSGNSVDNNKKNHFSTSEDTEEEVQSPYKGPLDAMESLEDVLPIRRGISRFYKGKSKSFASLADVASVKDIAKPENSYAKRRRNLLACSLYWDKNRNFPLRSNNGGISKRVTHSSRTTLALAVAKTATNPTSTTASASDGSWNPDTETTTPRSTTPLSRFHPLFKELHGAQLLSAGGFPAWRSFSLADLRECGSVSSSSSSPGIASATRTGTKLS